MLPLSSIYTQKWGCCSIKTVINMYMYSMKIVYPLMGIVQVNFMDFSFCCLKYPSCENLSAFVLDYFTGI